MLKESVLDAAGGTRFTLATASAGVGMRGTDRTTGLAFSYVDLGQRIAARHPLRKLRQIVNDALASLDAKGR